MRFARNVYRLAAIYGILVLLPQYFLLAKHGRDTPPAITHPEYYYGFTGLALVFQLVFLLIASDPPHYRALMPITVLEKLAFGLPAVILFLQGRLATDMLAAGAIDLFLGTLFTIAYLRTASAPQTER